MLLDYIYPWNLCPRHFSCCTYLHLAVCMMKEVVGKIHFYSSSLYKINFFFPLIDSKSLQCGRLEEKYFCLYPAVFFNSHHCDQHLTFDKSFFSFMQPHTHQRRMPSARDLKRLASDGFIGRMCLQSGSSCRALFIQLTKATFSSSVKKNVIETSYFHFHEQVPLNTRFRLKRFICSKAPLLHRNRSWKGKWP